MRLALIVGGWALGNGFVAAAMFGAFTTQWWSCWTLTVVAFAIGSLALYSEVRP